MVTSLAKINMESKKFSKPRFQKIRKILRLKIKLSLYIQLETGRHPLKVQCHKIFDLNFTKLKYFILEMWQEKTLS